MISVIIPTLNEEQNLPGLIKGLVGEGVAHEIIVADGGSADQTVAVAKNLGVRVVHSAPGRGRQLAAGAEKAIGDTVLFLHADTVFPEAGLAAISVCCSTAMTTSAAGWKPFTQGSGRAGFITGIPDNSSAAGSSMPSVVSALLP